VRHTTIAAFIVAWHLWLVVLWLHMRNKCLFHSVLQWKLVFAHSYWNLDNCILIVADKASVTKTLQQFYKCIDLTRRVAYPLKREETCVRRAPVRRGAISI